jgi:transcriptional regulator with XRE-family HTH domain
MYGLEKSLGLRISQLRSDRGWTQKDLASQIGISANHLSRIEKDKVQPHRSTLRAIAGVFSIELEDLEALARIAEPDISETLAKQDPDLAALISQIPLLSEPQTEALRVFLRSMIAYQKVRQATGSLAS